MSLFLNPAFRGLQNAPESLPPKRKDATLAPSPQPRQQAVVWGAQMECGNKRRRRVLRHVHQSAGFLLNVSAFLSRFVSMQ